MTPLAETLETVRRRIRRQGSRRINEENTKATLIEPVLRALGWDVEDVDEVQREFKTKTRHKPVDYGLLLMRTPRLLIEAKALHANLNDHKWVNQIMGYATVAGVEWVVLTNGDGYRIYNAHAPVVVEEKLFRSVNVADGGPEVEQTLELLAKDRLEENRIEVLWRAQFVDRQVSAAIEDMFGGGKGAESLVKHITTASKNLTTEEVRASIARCRLDLDFPVDAQLLLKKKTKKKSKARGARSQHELSDLIAAGVLKPPVALTKTYKGKLLTATIHTTGKITVGKKELDSPSAAAAAAIEAATGTNRAAVNGWSFWQVESSNGSRVTLATFRPTRRQPTR